MFIVRILIGPVVFLIIRAIPIVDLETNGQIALAIYGWIIAWWILTPVPWAVTALLPLILFPLFGIMNLRYTAELYGQRILFFLVGIMLVGYAFQKHGLAKRIALNVLCIKGIATSGSRIILVIIAVTAVSSAFIDNAANIALWIPIAMSVARSVVEINGKSGGTGSAPRFLAASALAVLYGSVIGGLATPAGVPFNPLTISILEQLTSYSVTFGQWTATGVIFMIVLIPLVWIILRIMSPSEIKTLGGGSIEFFQEEKKKLGKVSLAEKYVLIVFFIMIAMWFFPPFLNIAAIRFIDMWYVPAAGALLLYLLPVDIKTREMTLGQKDFQAGVNWNVLFLVIGGSATAGALVNLGVTDWLTSVIGGGMTTTALPWITGVITTLVGHNTSGTATTNILSTILFPIAEGLGYNATILARIIAAMAFGAALPWSGAGPAAAFATGEIKIADMIRIGVVVTVVTLVVVVILSMLLVPAFGAYTII